MSSRAELLVYLSEFPCILSVVLKGLQDVLNFLGQPLFSGRMGYPSQRKSDKSLCFDLHMTSHGRKEGRLAFD